MKPVKYKLTPKEINESDIKRQLKDYLNYKGYFNFHILQGIGAYKGIPDRIAIKDGKVFFIEVKTYRGKQSEYQKIFQERIEKTGGSYLLIRDLNDLIEALGNK